MLHLAFLAMWVTVMNPQGIWNANGYFEFGEQCLIDNPLMVDHIGNHDQYRLYRYVNQAYARGTLCPFYTLFLMEPATLEAAQSNYQKEKDTKATLRDAVQKLLEPKR